MVLIWSKELRKRNIQSWSRTHRWKFFAILSESAFLDKIEKIKICDAKHSDIWTVWKYYSTVLEPQRGNWKTLTISECPIEEALWIGHYKWQLHNFKVAKISALWISDFNQLSLKLETGKHWQFQSVPVKKHCELVIKSDNSTISKWQKISALWIGGKNSVSKYLLFKKQSGYIDALRKSKCPPAHPFVRG